MNTNNTLTPSTETKGGTRLHLGLWSRRGVFGLLLAGLVALVSTSAQAAPTLTGTYVTPLQSGSLSYTAVRAFRGGSEGNFVVGGKRYPGSAYAARGGGTGLVWYFGTSGIMAGNALLTAQPDGTYAGPIWFFDRAGNTTDTGTLTLR